MRTIVFEKDINRFDDERAVLIGALRGALSAAESDRASTSRDLRGSIMPSSQSRAEA